MDRLKIIKKHLRPGDTAEIAELTSYSQTYVRQVLNPNIDRHNDSIIDAAYRIAMDRRNRIIYFLEDALAIPV